MYTHTMVRTLFLVGWFWTFQWILSFYRIVLKFVVQKIQEHNTLISQVVFMLGSVVLFFNAFLRARFSHFVYTYCPYSRSKVCNVRTYIRVRFITHWIYVYVYYVRRNKLVPNMWYGHIIVIFVDSAEQPVCNGAVWTINSRKTQPVASAGLVTQFQILFVNYKQNRISPSKSNAVR